MAEHFQTLGKKVILVGRTESKLERARSNLESRRKDGVEVKYYVQDTGKVSELGTLVERVMKENPDVDCLINNAGVQRPLELDGLELEKADNEIDINIRGPIHLATLFLPHLKKKPVGVIINVSSVLGFLPYSIINPVYNGTKAFVHFWTMTQRVQLSKPYPNLRVVEVVPPSVGTDLHRERSNPDDNKKHLGAVNSLTVQEFIQQFSKGLEMDLDTISAGRGIPLVQRWYSEFGDEFESYAEKYQGYKA
ncbi:putative short-chain dehydrogenases/reductase [Violaceomyces palustris]|uniref:Short-chain dehydrogenases/reductase n=1 Tax=Violaceomyces palustris TaxID=1673888 RepID=A0ACD0P717_9BASI|nr:putative short-chain dehydrogenases/reductase [Violaceomyces palustris]